MFGKCDFKRRGGGLHLGIELHRAEPGKGAPALRCLAALGLGLIVLQAAPAQANFCKKVMSERALTEARLMTKEDFAKPDPGDSEDFKGDKAYNADVITCNRKRDTNGKDIEKAIAAGHKFADNLEARTVKGKYDYYSIGGSIETILQTSVRKLSDLVNPSRKLAGSAVKLAYAYDIRRENGEWIVRAPMRFHWPTGRKTDMIDIPKELVTQLADTSLTALCDKTVMDKNGRQVASGAIPIENKAAGVKGRDTLPPGEDACRVKRSTKVGGVSILGHLRQFYADALTTIWNRPGFRIDPVLIEHGEGTKAQIEAWDKDGVIWELRLNLKPGHRASYKRWAFKWNHMYTGLRSEVIAHEFGHKMGLDDEYGWGPEWSQSQSACGKRPGKPDEEYIMCSQWAARDGAKGVYPWIVTRRYAVAFTPGCKQDSGCGDGLYCAKGVLGVGRNKCEPLKVVGIQCTRDAQCGSNRCNVGKCAAEHACLSDPDCGTGKFCKIGLGDLDRNTCQVKLADGKACTLDKQCSSGACSGWRPQDGQVSGICYTANSKVAGASCKIDLECATGACNSAKRCVCKKDSDCAGGQHCDKGFDFKQNSCRTKLAKGQACGKYGDLGVSRRCKSGKCSTKTGLGVLGVTTIFCK